MDKKTKRMLIVLTVFIILACAAYLYIQMWAEPPVSPTVSSSIKTAPLPVSSVQWAGHTWDVTDYDDGQFTTDQVWVDAGGRLHMKLIYDGKWHDFNLIQQDIAHYGTYRYVLDTDVNYIQDRQNGGNPYFVFSPFTFDNSSPQTNYGEIDIEMCKWGADHSNTDWTIHSANHKVQSNHFVGAGNTHTMEWKPNYIKFSVEGPKQPYTEYLFTDDESLPADTGHTVNIIHLGQYKDAAPPGNLTYYEAEVVLSEYTFTPCVNNSTAIPTPRPTASPTRTPFPVSSVQWAGHTWDVTDYDDGQFTTDQVWVDAGGRLHMKLIYDGKWHDFNLIQQEAAGYGTYRWTVASDVNNIQDIQDGGNPHFVFSPFLFDSTNSQRIDIRMTKRGIDSPGNNTYWTIVSSAGPHTQANRIVGWGNTWTLEWMPDHVRFSVQGPSQPYKEWVYANASEIPLDAGGMKSMLMIGQSNGSTLSNETAYYDAEVVLSNYQYIPYMPTASLADHDRQS